MIKKGRFWFTYLSLLIWILVPKEPNKFKYSDQSIMENIRTKTSKYRDIKTKSDYSYNTFYPYEIHHIHLYILRF